MIGRVLAAVGIKAGPAGKPEPWRLEAVAELLDALRDSGLADDAAVRPSLDVARLILADQSAEPASRVAAARLLGRSRDSLDADRAELAGRLDPSEPAEVQLASIRALARRGDSASAEAILSRWSRLGPSTRLAALDALLARVETTERLVAALETGRVSTGQLDAARRERLLKRHAGPLRERAERVLGPIGAGVASRQKVLDAYAPARSQPGDPTRGRAVFERVCASCHKLGGIGHEVGPDLAALTDTTPEGLSIAILDPNRDVDARYASYTAALKDGRVLTGLIVAETASAITLKRQDSQVDSLLRADLEELTTAGRSLMPEGLENDLKPADLADLLAFVARPPSPPKSVEGNHPITVNPRPDGSIALTAATAEIRGPSLTFETEHANLGYWQSAGDHAVWNVAVRGDVPTKFTASLEWACDDASAGNRYEILVDHRPIRRATIGGTGGWSVYRSLFLLELTLAPGTHRIEMRAAGPVRGALADVRVIVLTPRKQ